ncbi:hypothetical protein J5N97_029691 [Dioscorea zingiberensis]|uniref:Ribosomal protein S14 n=1 Tax=Dioscorea zingiberensis TaxID=325984 RepID=A0A9D5H3F6_9LILI|nr:hypothetical protein J5N97_029691 [Dioscorea zingiberensis]
MEPKEENVTLGPTVRDGEHVFGVAHIFASFNDTFIHVTDLYGRETLVRITASRQLEKPLKDQFMVRRALEKALGYMSSAIDSSNDSSMPKLDKREPDDSFLSLVIWTPGETSQSNEPPEICCNS